MNWKTIENPLFASEMDRQFAKLHYELSIQSPPNELFHYTSSDAFLGIINSSCMFATEFSYLNDPGEYNLGLKAFRDYLNSLSPDSSFSPRFINQFLIALDEKKRDDLRIFVLSFSANPDLLSQWRAYGSDGMGFCMGFDGATLRDRSGFGEYSLYNMNLDTLPKNFIYSYHLLPVIYDQRSKDQQVSLFVEAAYCYWSVIDAGNDMGAQDAFRLLIGHRIKEFLISFKDDQYKDEAEWRIVTTIHKHDKRIDYMNGKFGLAPYVRLNLSRKSDLPSNKIPLSSLWIGPSAKEANNPKGLEMLLQTKCEGAKLEFSQVSYRGG